MKLVSFSVQRFRNILETGDISVDPHVTCLVGKNESGKTNVLNALHTLKTALNDRSFDAQHYPRWLLKEHQRSGEFESATPIQAKFELDDADIEAVEERFGGGVLTDRSFIVSMRYDNSLYYALNMDEEIACQAFETSHGTNMGAVTIRDLKAALAAKAEETAPDDADGQVQAGDSPRAAAALSALNRLYPDEPSRSVFQSLWQRAPRFFYFDDYSQLQGRIDIAPLVDALRTNTESTLDDSQRTALSLLKLGFANEDLVNSDYEKRTGEMEAVAADLTRQVRRYWRQNDRLRLRIDIEPIEETRPDGVRIVSQLLQLRVEDDRNFFTTNLDVRSSGFRWFVSFLAAFKEFAANQSVIVLLDEPALSLHPRAQRDFLEFIEERLADNHQVVYTTHSPFMVDAGHLERVRVVEDMGPEIGATVKSQLSSRDPDTLSPIQGALGYDIAQNIFVGPDNLVVGDLSDYTYLTVMSEVLREQRRPFLDPRWRVLPAGSAGTLAAAVSLLGQELDVTVLVDGGSHLPQKLSSLVDDGILERSRVITLGSLLGTPGIADIEDVFDVDDYLNFYNSALNTALAASSLDAGDRIVAKITRATAPFNHNDPASWFLANRATVVPNLKSATVDRFEQLILAINATLRTSS